jgi:hypothetical protein
MMLAIREWILVLLYYLEIVAVISCLERLLGVWCKRRAAKCEKGLEEWAAIWERNIPRLGCNAVGVDGIFRPHDGPPC